MDCEWNQSPVKRRVPSGENEESREREREGARSEEKVNEEGRAGNQNSI